MVERAVVIKIGVRDAQDALKQLKSIGIEASRSLEDKIPQGAKKASSALGTLDSSGSKTSAAFRNLSTNIALVEGPLGGVAGRFGALSALFGRVNPAIAAGTIAFAGLSLGATKAAKAGADLEVQQLRIQAVLKATGGVSGKTAEDIERLSRSIGEGTLASTNEVRDAAAQLLTFRKIAGDTFDRTLRGAQDLASLGFTSLSGAALQLGKALEDPATGMTALRRSGVSFTKDQQETIKALFETGEVAKAQGLILDELSKQTGGVAEAQGKSLAGALDTVSEKFQITIQAIGAAILETDFFKKSLADAAHQLDRINEALDPSLTSQMADATNDLAQAERNLADAQRARLGGVGVLGGNFDAEQRAVDAAKARIELLRLETTERERAAIAARKDAEARAAIAVQEAKDEAAAETLRKQRELAAKDAEKLAKTRKDAITSLRQEVSDLSREATALQVSAEARAAVALQIKIETEQRKLGLDAGSEEGQQIADQIRQRAELQGEIEATTKAREDEAKAAQKAADDAVKAQQKAADEIRKSAERVADDVTTFATDAFITITDQGVESFNDIAENALAIMRRLFVRLVAEAALRPIIIPIATSFLGGGTAGAATPGGALSLASTAGGFAGVGGSIAGALGTTIVGGGGPTRLTPLATAGGAPGLTVGGALGFGAGGAIGGNLLAQLIGGNSTGGTIGGGGGAVLGAALGTAFPGIGTVAGGVAGGVIGSLAGSAIGGFGDDQDGGAALGQFNLRRLVASGLAAPGKAGSFNLKTRGQAFAQSGAFAEILRGLGGDTRGLNLAVRAGTVDHKQGLRFNVFRGQGGNNLADLTDTGTNPAVFFREINQAILGMVDGLDDVTRTILENTKDLGSLDEVAANLQFAELYKTLRDGTPEATAAQKAIDNLNAEFKEARKTAHDLGLDVKVLADAQRQAKIDLTTGFDEGIRLRILQITDPMTAALEQWHTEFLGLLDDAKTLGGDLAQVRQLNRDTIAQIKESFRVDATNGITDFIRSITSGSQSPLASSVKFSNSERDFRRTRRLARQGDVGALADFTGVAQNYLAAGSEQFATGPQFAGIYSEVLRAANYLNKPLSANDNSPTLETQQAIGAEIVTGNALTESTNEWLARLLDEQKETNRLLRRQLRAA